MILIGGLFMRTVGRIAAFGLLSFGVGCGGSGIPTEVNVPDGYYRGTVTVNNEPPLLPGSGTGVADVQAAFDAQDLEIFAMSPNMDVTVSRIGNKATLVSGVTFLTGTLQVTRTTNGFTFRFSDQGITYATGSLDMATLPVLGSQASVPPWANFDGDFLIVANGRVRGYGTVLSTMDPQGNWVAHVIGGGEYIGQGLLAGQFQPTGTVTSARLVWGNTSYWQVTDPQYSWDGKTLIVRYDTLRLEPGSVWLTMVQTSP